jgi:hypothetical protein
MAGVVFVFNSQPDLNERQALEVSEALSARRNLAAQSAARKIRGQARVNVDAGETRTAVELEREEVAELVAVISEAAWPTDEPQYARLLRQLSRASSG